MCIGGMRASKPQVYQRPNPQDIYYNGNIYDPKPQEEIDAQKTSRMVIKNEKEQRGTSEEDAEGEKGGERRYGKGETRGEIEKKSGGGRKGKRRGRWQKRGVEKGEKEGRKRRG